MLKDALYYPHIALTNPAYVKSLALFFDRVYRIVPDNVIPEDHPELQPLLEEGLVGSVVDPAKYATDASQQFLDKLDEWGAAALMHGEADSEQLAGIHQDKTDQRVRTLFQEAGFKSDNEWLYVPTELASNYMLYLATEISKRNSLSLVTRDWGAWTGTSYFRLDGKLDESITPETNPEILNDPYSLYSLILSELVPLNISEIPADDIVTFRQRRQDEIACFRNAIEDLQLELANLDSQEIRIDRIKDKARSLEKARHDYQSSADIIKAKHWFGVSLMGFPAPIVFGELMSIPTASTVVLGASGLAIGALFSLKSSREDLRRLNAEQPSSYLIELRRSFRGYTTARGGGDINYHAWNCMEEYVND